MTFILIGILLTQLLYVLGNWRLHRSRDYLGYARYILLCLLYIACSFPETIFPGEFGFAGLNRFAAHLQRPLALVLIVVYISFADDFLELAHLHPVAHKRATQALRLIMFLALIPALMTIWPFARQSFAGVVYLLISVIVSVISAWLMFRVFFRKSVHGQVILPGSLAMIAGWLITNVIVSYKSLQGLGYTSNPDYIPFFTGAVIELFFFNLAIARKVVIQEEDTAATQKQIINQLRLNEQLVIDKQLIRNKIARDLHDELGSTLSGVALFSELSLRSISRRQYQDTAVFLRRITQECTFMTDKMNDIIWTSHAENDSMKKILKRLFEYARPLCAARNIRFISDIESVPEDAIIEPAVRNHVYLFSKEAINNAVKHAGAGEIVYSAGFVDGNCVVMIADDGKGFDTGVQYEGNGIKNMRVRAGEMGLALTIVSSPGEGTCITLKMKSND